MMWANPNSTLTPNALMRAQPQMGGDTLNIPAWTDLVSPADPGGGDPNLSNDSPAQLSTRNKIKTETD